MSDELRARMMQVLAYDTESGLFTWLCQASRSVKADQVAGNRSGGRVHVKLFGTRYVASRVAWLFVHGQWPQHEIDHINGDATDNRLVNLRDVTPSLNQQNKRNPQTNSTTGLLGVTKAGGRWQAQICVSKKRLYLGRYESPEEAQAAYLEAKRKLHPGFVETAVRRLGRV